MHLTRFHPHGYKNSFLHILGAPPDHYVPASQYVIMEKNHPCLWWNNRTNCKHQQRHISLRYTNLTLFCLALNPLSYLLTNTDYGFKF